MSTYLQAMHCKNTGPVPIWLMRQAGRYMACYQKIRRNYSFSEMIKTPEIACEITLQPVKAFGFDAAILFSDILNIPEALGCHLEFIDGVGPVIHNPIKTPEDLKRLSVDGLEEKLSFVPQAIKRVKISLPHTPLIGFAGAPFTVASYMFESSKQKKDDRLKQLIYNKSTLFHALLQCITKSSITYLEMQIQAGVDSLQIFDSWCNILSWNDYCEFSLPYLKQIVDTISARHSLPICIFGLASSNYHNLLQNLNIQAISLDIRANLSQVREKTHPKVALQGNLDPYLLLAPKERLKDHVRKILDSMGSDPAFIFNLGHGVLAQTPEDNVAYLVDCIRRYSG